MKTIGMYDPYFHILGGAERYVLSIAECFRDAQVILYVSDPKLLDAAMKKFGMKLTNITCETWDNEASPRDEKLKSLDLFFYVTDGSLFVGMARRNVLIVQTPLHVPTFSVSNWYKLRSWEYIVCYSEFMRSIAAKKLRRSVDTLFVPVETPQKITAKKDNQIVSIGRFFPHLHSKKQKEMVETFREMVDQGLTKTELVLIGSVDPGGEKYFEEVKSRAKGYPVRILENATHEDLVSTLSRAKVYWHATGWGEDLTTHPERAEHFGVSTIEAMSYGAVPVVYAGGGQVEIVKQGESGYCFKRGEELQNYTKQLLTDTNMWNKMSQNAIDVSRNYSQEKFCERLKEILH